MDQAFLFEDILEFDRQPMDTVRLSASTIEQLFKDTIPDAAYFIWVCSPERSNEIYGSVRISEV